MWYNFWLQNIHFAIEVFVALVCFATAWLYIDSWGTKKEFKTLIRALGFFTLALWAVISVISTEFFSCK